MRCAETAQVVLPAIIKGMKGPFEPDERIQWTLAIKGMNGAKGGI